MNVTAEYIYTEEEAIRGMEEVTKSVSQSLLLRLLARLLVRGEARRRFKTSPTANKKVVWEFDDLQIQDSTEGAVAVRSWKNLLEIKEVKGGFLIFVQVRIAQWIPKTAFASETDISNLRELIRKNGVRFNF